MKLQDDFTTLNWVKSELDETLKQARQALEAYVDDPADTSLMRFCANYLHQVQGTLRMVELYGAAMVVEEMERLAEALLDGRVKQRDDAYSVLMRGMVQLPDYLERVQSGHKDIPIVLLPMLNDLRTCRGENLLSESVLFSPDLGAAMPPAAAGVAQPLPVEIQRAHALKVRTAFQVALLKWLREDAPVPAAARLREVLDHLRSISFNEESRRLFWVAAGVADAILDGALESSATVKLLFGRVDRAIRMFADAGEQALQDESPRDLVKNLLYYVAHSTSHSARVDEIRATYRLGSLLPTEQEVDHAKGSISGHNRTLLDTVSVAIKDDLLRVKEALDIFLRAQQRDPADLLAQVELLDRVRDTLGMLGLGAPRRVVTEQREIIEEIASGRRGDDEGTLLDVAGALLYVEASLDDHIDRLGAPGADDSASDDEVDGMRPLPKAEVRKLLDALMREAEVNIQQAKHDVIAFVESPWDHDRVVHIPALLDEIAGALRMLDLSLAAELMIGIVRFVEVELLRHRRVPTAEQMDHLADALASIEYFLEATREQRNGRERILDVTCASLGDLGYWPVPQIADDAELEQSSADAAESSHDSALATAAALPHAGQAAADVFGFEASSSDTTELSASDFPQWGEHLPMGSSESLQPEVSIEGDGDVVESPEMSAFVDSELELTTSSDTAAEDAAAAPLELTSAVDVAPGLDLHDLIIGDAALPPAREQDLAGLKLVETTHDQEPAPAEDAWIDVEEEVEEDVDASSAAEGDFGFGTSEIDDEIREIFLEEVEEEIDGLRNQLPHWRAQPDNMEHVTSIRRSFHTLKGSGRLVGATALGEFSFKIENLLNCVLDRSISPSPQVVGLVEHAIDALPQFQAALQDQGAPTANLDGIVDTAAKLSAGELLWLPERQSGKRTVKRIVRKRVPVETVAVANADIGPAFKSPTPEIVAGPLPGLDPVLFEILKSEVAQHLESIDGFLSEAKASPQVVSKPVLRAVHTLNGAIAMVEIPVLVNVLAPLENLVKRLRAQLQPIDEQAIGVLDDSVALIRDVMLRLDHGSADLPDSNELARRVETLRDQLPEPVSAFAIYNDDEPSDAAFDASDPGDAGEPIAQASSPDESALGSDEDADRALLDNAWLERADEVSAEPIVMGDSATPEYIDSIDLPAHDLTAAFIGGFEDGAESAALAVSVQALETATSEDASDLQEEAGQSELPSVDLSQAWQEQSETAGDDFGSADDYAALFAEATAAMDALPQQASESSDDLEIAIDSVAESAELDSLAASIDAISVDPVSDWMTPVASADEIADAALKAIEARRSAPQTTDAERVEAERAEAERVEAERVEAERVEAERVEAERVEAQRVEAERVEAERVEAERVEAERVEAGHVEAEHVEAGHVEVESVEAESADGESIEAELGEVASVEPVRATLAEAQTVLPPPQDDPHPAGRLDLPDVDDDLLDIFVQEGHDILDSADSVMAKLRESPDEHALLGELQRDLHTLKGGARMAGLVPIGDLTHAMEGLLDAVHDGRRQMDRGVVEAFERGFDRLHGMVQRVGNRHAIAMPVHAIARLEQLASGDLTEVTDAALEVPARAASEAADMTMPAAPAESTPVAAVVKPRRILDVGADDEAPRAPQEMIRVRSELLDSLVNYAGEVSIYRSRLEQQISSFRFNLIEFEQTVSRLREQLRKLEIETEAQIIARYQREHQEGSTTTFDPLELDRFSQLQQYSRALGESVSDLVSIQGLLDDLTRQSETLLLQQSRVSSDLQEGLMRTRMVPFDSLVPSLRRTLRQAAQELGKRAQLRVDGAHGEMDRNLLERMKAPFEHMLRNALAHGIETPEERLAAGKPLDGSITITVAREATEVLLRISDDGRGMDGEAIRRKAIERGMLSPEVELSDRDLYGFVMEPGFSTAEQVTQLSGRGVGMDVVHSEIKQLGGSLVIDSVAGQGTTFIIRLPFTLAVTQAILVRLGEAVYAVPMSTVQGVVRISQDDYATRLQADRPSYNYVGEEFTMHELSYLLGVAPTRVLDDGQLPLLMTRTGDQRAAVRIDAVLGSREVVVKSVGPQINSVPGVFGATIMGDGSVVMILDLAPLVRRAAALRANAEAGGSVVLPAMPVMEHAEAAKREPLIMVVDDSITMRKVTTRVLERADMEVITAKDGLDAVEKLQDNVPDLMLLDIEMPRMDGYELATYMRNDPRLKHVPIIMVTSRTGEKHRQRALEIGVERYLGKPYQEADLLRQVQETLQTSRVHV